MLQVNGYVENEFYIMSVPVCADFKVIHVTENMVTTISHTISLKFNSLSMSAYKMTNSLWQIYSCLLNIVCG